MQSPKFSKKMHAANKARRETGAKLWGKRADNRGLWKRCAKEPQLVLSEKELEYLRDIAGKRVCVLGSGDNEVVFALAGLGGIVTSVDISEGQLKIASERAKQLGLKIDFVQSDVTDLSKLWSNSFDVVYTGGHVAVWVSDLQKYYSEAARILKPDGLFIVCEYHPFRRIWKNVRDALIVESSYFDRGPFEYDASSDVLEPKAGTYPTYEFHWTVSDHLNAVMKAGCRLVVVDEFGEGSDPFELAPFNGLPESLLIISQKGKA